MNVESDIPQPLQLHEALAMGIEDDGRLAFYHHNIVCLRNISSATIENLVPERSSEVFRCPLTSLQFDVFPVSSIGKKQMQCGPLAIAKQPL
jgi:hypothetical protein